MAFTRRLSCLLYTSYQGGYSPTVSDGQAQIVLPLIDGAGSQQVKAGAEVNISVNLGDPSKAPFVFNNYDTVVKKQSNSLADGSTRDSYLVNLDLPLAENRTNGNYLSLIHIWMTFWFSARGRPVLF